MYLAGILFFVFKFFFSAFYCAKKRGIRRTSSQHSLKWNEKLVDLYLTILVYAGKKNSTRRINLSPKYRGPFSSTPKINIAINYAHHC